MRKLLVANRGEIACRIFASARRLGLTCVAVYSDADSRARHVREADEALRLGPAPARESYLNIARVLECARESGADAIHPGYGFLAESAAFAQACVQAGILFVGPPAAVIARMGDKAQARARARALGIPVLPGYEGEAQDIPELCREARRLGFPLMIKPSGGGGGKGMSVITGEEGLEEALTAARRLAQSSFGDGRLVLERYLAAPRHIEVQILADSHGHVLTLGDRDCSIQRRHQKLIEEAPAPGLSAELRAQLCAAAVLLARDVGYVSAGTVEFLLEGGSFHFLEMNTRLQVEHPVTEAVTGLDLVEWQLRVARGEPLTLGQEEVRIQGAALEARVCAEDPYRDFLPSAGSLTVLEWPGGESIRVDAGFTAGDLVPDSYDSLLGKVIAWAPAREEARARLAAALEQTRCAGVHSNERWLARIVRDARFAAVTHSVAFLSAHAAELATSPPVADGVLILAALAAHAAAAQAAEGPLSPWEISDAFTPNLPEVITWPFQVQGVTRPVTLSFARGTPVSASVGGQGTPLTIAQVQVTGQEVSAQLGERRLHARYLVTPDRIHLWLREAHQEVLLEEPGRRRQRGPEGEQRLTTPLPGVVVSVAVEAGQQVAAGQLLMVIEAMKMEHPIKAPSAGTVKVIHVRVGEQVKEDSELAELLPVIVA
jgi:3-methylcrotonyl-CoA carboxylase alpha subunit